MPDTAATAPVATVSCTANWANETSTTASANFSLSWRLDALAQDPRFLLAARHAPLLAALPSTSQPTAKPQLTPTSEPPHA